MSNLLINTNNNIHSKKIYNSLPAANSVVSQNTQFDANQPQGFNDSVTFGKSEKKKSSSSKKIVIGIGVLAGAVGVGALLLKGKFNDAIKLAEKIEFKSAGSIDEAKAFATKHLGIKHYDVDNLEVANLVNEGLVNLNNFVKGKAKMPKAVSYLDIDGKALALMTHSDKLCLNKLYLGNLDKVLSEQIQIATDIGLFNKMEDGSYRALNLYNTEDFQKLLDKFVKTKDCTFGDKIELYQNMKTMGDIAHSVETNPGLTLKKIFNDEKIAERIKGLKYQGKPLNLQEILSMDKEKQIGILVDICRLREISFVRDATKFDSIYHELGHLQHRECCKKFKMLDKPDVYKRNGIEVPADVKEFINNEQIQNTAAEVSEYAQSSPLEFVAEAYMQKINGRKHGDAVNALYQKYEGPTVS